MIDILNRLFVKTAFVLFCVYLTPAKLTSTGLQSFVINDVSTSIDISTQLVNIDYRLSLVSSEDNLKSFIFTVDPLLANSVSYISAKGKSLALNKPLVYQDNGVWEVFFEHPVMKGQKQYVSIFVIYTNILKSFPEKIKQSEKHLVIFSGPISLYSPYLCLNHTSYVTVGKGLVERITKPNNFKLKDSSQLLTFTSKTPTKPYANTQCLIHYEHMIPFLTVKDLHRNIEISHWGSIKIHEEIFLENTGAKLYGPYHRDLKIEKGSNNVKFFTTILPAAASDIIVYDDIGVISSFKTKSKKDCIELELYPRFLLYGGWKTKYYLTYNVPAYEYLFNNGDDYALKIRAVDHVFNDMFIDNAIVNIILPEGTEEFSMQTPFSVHHLNQSYHFSYLDTVGRPVLSFTKQNLVEQHIQDFVLSYKFHKLKMFFEPFYIIAFIQSIFIAIIIFGRLDFRISNKYVQDNVKEICAVKVAGVNKAKKKKH